MLLRKLILWPQRLLPNAFCISHLPFSIFRFYEYFIFIRFLSFCQLMRLKMFLIISAAFAEWVVIRMGICICISDSECEWLSVCGWLCACARDVPHSPCGQSHLLRLICDSHHKQSKQSVPISSSSPFSCPFIFPFALSSAFLYFLQRQPSRRTLKWRVACAKWRVRKAIKR